MVNVESVSIDRDQENKDVLKFQETGDLKLLEKVYLNRVPTLKMWANKHYYPGLTFSVDDLFEDFAEVFVIAAEKYQKGRGSFNTCLFTFLLNRVKNIKSSRHAKKRLPESYHGYENSMILSLDYSYNDGECSDTTLKDIIPDENNEEASSNIEFEEMLEKISNGNKILKDFFKKIGEGNTVGALIKEYKIKKGLINISNDQSVRLSKRKCTKIVSDLLKEKKIVNGDFSLVDYKVDGRKLKYSVELKRTDETDLIMKSVRHLKKNKSQILDSLK